MASSESQGYISIAEQPTIIERVLTLQHRLVLRDSRSAVVGRSSEDLSIRNLRLRREGSPDQLHAERRHSRRSQNLDHG